MATLQKIRNRGGLLVSVVIGLALIAFIVGDALSSGASVFNNSRNKVGEIAGESISIIDFQKKLAKNEELIKASNGAASLSEEQQEMLRENTWQQLVMDIVMTREYQELGIEVSGDEMYDMLLGSNMHPSVRQLFADPNTGEVDLDRARSIIKSLIDAPANTPQKSYWLNMEEQIATSRRQAKYNTLVAKALFVTDAEAQASAENSVNKSDISYIVKNYTTLEDSTLKISDSEIKEYYNSHSKLFDQPASRKIVYVNFDITASPEDYKETEKIIVEMVDEFGATPNAMEFVELSSDKKADAQYYKKEEIENDSLANFLFNGNNGVFGPYLENNSYKIAKVAGSKMLADSVRARHILIAPQNNDYAQAKAIADSLAKLLKGGANFEALAQQNSVDQNSAVNGGDLGWFGPRMMVQPFSDSVFFSKKNEIKVVLTQFGAHVVQVTDMAKPVQKIQIATVEKEVLPSQKTTNQIYNDARTFAAEVQTTQDFDKKAAEVGVTKRIATVNQNERTIAGLTNARELVRQIYLSETPGNIVTAGDGSTVFETGDKFTIAVLTDVTEEGIAPLNSVAANIKRELAKKKKAEILKKELESMMSGSESLLSVAQKAGLDVREATEVTFNSFQVPGAGIEPNVIAVASLIEQGKLSAPIEGNQGVYVILVNNRITDAVTPDMLSQAKMSAQQSGMYRANYQAMQALMKNANITDLRYKFY